VWRVVRVLAAFPAVPFVMVPITPRPCRALVRRRSDQAVGWLLLLR
jgi:hypothetical protein